MFVYDNCEFIGKSRDNARKRDQTGTTVSDEVVVYI